LKSFILILLVDCKNNTFVAIRYYDEKLDTVFSKFYVNGKKATDSYEIIL